MYMKLQNVKLILCLSGLILVMGCKPQGGSTSSSVPSMDSRQSEEELVARYFPRKELPLEVNPNDPVPAANIIVGKDKEQLFPNATDGDIHALARLELFPDHTTIVYRENWLYSDTYIVTYRNGKYSTNKGQIIADIFTDGEGVEGYNFAKIERNGIIKRSGTTDDGETFETIGTYQYSADNELREE
jgi:hypothetical protein